MSRVPPRDALAVAPAALAVLAGLAVASASTLAARLLLARSLGPEDLGRLLLGVAVASAAGGVASLGLAAGAAQRVAELRAAGDDAAARAAGRTAALAATLSGAAAAGVLAVAGLSVAGVRVLLPLAPVAVGFAAGQALLGLSRGWGDVGGRAVVRDGLGGLLRLAGVAVALGLGARLGGSAAGYAAGALAGELAFALYVARRRWLRRSGGPRWDSTVLRRSPPFVLLELLGQASQWFDVLLLGLLAPAREVGLYGAARGLVRAVEMASEAAGHRFLPAATMAFLQGGGQALARLYARTRIFVVALAAPALAVAVLFPGLLLGALFGPAFGAAAPALRWLALALLLAVVMGYSEKALVAAGAAARVARVSAIALAAAVATGVVAVPRWGASGAALAWGVLVVVRRGLLWLEMRRMGMESRAI